jgi:hypothetical protein
MNFGTPRASRTAAVIRRSPPWACAAFGEALYRYTA